MLDPERKKVWIVLSLLILSVASGIVGMFVKYFKPVGVMAKSVVAEKSLEVSPMLGAAPTAAPVAEIVKPFPWLEVIFVAIVVVLAGLLIYYLKKSRMLKKKKK